MTRSTPIFARVLVLMVALAMLVTACGSPPTEDGAGDGAAAEAGAPATGTAGAQSPAATGVPAETGASETAARLEEIYAALEGLEGAERRDALVELAAEEDGEVNFYASTNIEDVAPVIEAFDEETGIAVTHYRGGGPELFQRVLREAEANYAGADVVLVGQADMLSLQSEGLLLPLQSPVLEELVQDAVTETIAPAYLAVELAAWNTDRVSPEEAPQTWEDVLSNYAGALAFEQEAEAMFGTLVQEYFMAEKGMTEEEAIDLFKEAARGATAIRGHSLGAEFLGAGEFDVHHALYLHHMRGLEEAPIAWEPAVEPMVYMPFSVGINALAQDPASALLFIDFILAADEGQALFAEVGRTPANRNVEEGAIPEEYEAISVPENVLTDERWRTIWLDEVLRLAGTAEG